jgi:hypothetical protein
MDKELFQTALRVLQQVNKRLPVDSKDAENLKNAAPSSHKGLAVDLIAVEIIQRQLKKRPKTD